MRLLDLYRRSLWLLPRGFRARFGASMLDMVEARRGIEEGEKRGIRRTLRLTAFWVREFGDLGRTALRERWRAGAASRSRGAIGRWGGRRRGGLDMRDDLRVALRGLARNPGFAAVVILTFAVGVGINTAIFSVVDTLVLRDLPFEEADRLVHLVGVDESSGRASPRIAYADFLEIRERAGGTEAVAGYSTGNWIVTTDGHPPARVPMGHVTEGFFETLGVEPILGRVFSPDEHVDGANDRVILSHAQWISRFGGSEDVLGRVVEFGQIPHTVVGVMPPGFDYPFLMPMGGWVPIVHREWTGATDDAFTQRDWTTVGVVARLADGTSIDRLTSEIEAISAGLSTAYPASNANLVHRPMELKELEMTQWRRPLLLGLGGVAIILLIAVLNVASLLLARGSTRRGEVAMRRALGASRARLIRLFLTESLVYAVLGSALGLLLAAGALELLPLLELRVPLLDRVMLDLRVLGMVGATTLLAAAVFGVLPAIRESRKGLAADASSTGRGRAHRTSCFQMALVGVEVAGATVLAIGAGLLLTSYARAAAQDPGFDPSGVLTLRLSVPVRYMQDPTDNWSGSNAYFAEVVEGIERLPGVDGVAMSYTNPLDHTTRFPTRIQIPGFLERERMEQPVANLHTVTPGFFEAFDIPAVRGRLLAERDDREGAGAVVVNEAFVRAVFGDENPLGHEITGPNFWGAVGYPYPWRIVGVVADVKTAGLNRAPEPSMYLPFAQAPMGNMRLMIRTEADPAGLVPAVRAAIWEVDPGVPVDDLITMERVVARSIAQERVAAASVAGVAGIALFLAMIGIYGVLSFSVGQRTAEFGIRQALGANAEGIVSLVVSRGMRVTALGIAIGVAVAGVLSDSLAGFLFETSPTEVGTYAIVASTLALVALGACLIPARRATRIDPVRALRTEQGGRVG